MSGGIAGQMVVGDQNVVVHAEHGSTVTLRTEGPPSVRRRSRPTGRAVPTRGLALFGRGDQLAELEGWLAEGHPVQIYGPPGCGKSALLRHLAAERGAAHREVVLLSAAGVPVEDLVEDLFHACYDAEDYKPDPARRRRLMGSVQALLLVDDFEGSADDLADLLDAAPGCDVVVTSAARCAEAEGRTLRLDGLPEEAALALIAQKLDRSLRDDEREAAERYIEAVQGNPLALVQAATAVRAAGRRHGTADASGFVVDEQAIATGVADRLSDEAAELLHILNAFAPLPVPGPLLSVLAGDVDRAAALGELKSLQLITSEGNGFRPYGRLTALVVAQTGPARDAGQFAQALAAWVGTKSTGKDVAAATAVIRRALTAAARTRKHTAVRDLARAAAPGLARSLRWGAWREVLELGRAAARELGAAEDEAYFAHEEDVRRKVLKLSTGLAISSAAGAGGALGHALSAPAKSGVSAVAGNPAVIGTAIAAVVAGGIFTALAVTGGEEAPVQSNAAPVSTESGIRASDSASDTPGSLTPGATHTIPSDPSSKPSLTASSMPPTSLTPTTGFPPPSISESETTKGPEDCLPTSAVPVSDGDAQFGPVNAGGGEESVSFQFKWLDCDDENSFSVADPDVWEVERTSCPPTAPNTMCVFSVTFRPAAPGDYQAQVTVLDDWGRPTVELPVTGTAVESEGPPPPQP
ncbi:hypothetical protein STRCI_002555 [Streptomyces cinnabarinus]|uniref:AAA+ ATPase domain-containing protein n=1 Tax=Streptomyces cinnabarinus TaxID=67287 RepID=A0ABY7KA79_9ACTN|nr:hypothetical protein [Streptomyces cinnabarinus]WAZ21388.1 hypothetical protein STRCI_002555 [Streptomyces cinnabarinus]